jgi:hypothetical protein
MVNYRTKRILPVILVIVIIIVAIIALVSLARAVFFSGSNAPSTEVVDVSRQALLNTTADRSVRMTVRGPIVADEVFQSYQINVTPSSRSLTTYTGYLDSVVDQQNLGNNSAAYEQFVYALDKADLAKGEAFEGEEDDTRGICATGRVYEFDIMNAGSAVKHLWTSTCNGSRGSLDASVEQLTELFTNQIPDASNTIRKVNLSI